jgi:dihydrofolate reductase
MTTRPIISAIAAISKNRALGKDNRLLWHIPEDFKHFKSVTMGHPVIMGRKTFESIGKALPGRLNVVVSRRKEYTAEGVRVVSSLESAIELAKTYDRTEIFIIGGGELYSQSMDYLDRLYLTIVDTFVDADTYFPDYSDTFTRVRSRRESSQGDLTFTFLTLERQG